MKMTLLDIVQNILSSANGSEVNSIGDSVEALQAASEVETAYFVLVNEFDQDTFKAAVQLDPSLDPDRPTHMKIPSNVSSFDWIRYKDTSNGDKWVDVQYLNPEEFLLRSFKLTGQDATQVVEDFNGVEITVASDRAPCFYTSFDDEWLIFDGYNRAVESTLQNSKTVSWAYVSPEWRNEDSFIPKLRVDLFPRLLSEAKSAFFINHKQVANSKEEQRSRRLITNFQNRQHRDQNNQSTSSTQNDYSRP